MNEPIQGWKTWVNGTREASGLGVCCGEAQADGVPCVGPVSDCPLCGRAAAARTARDAAAGDSRIVDTGA
jgi:hypothetical protein